MATNPDYVPQPGNVLEGPGVEVIIEAVNTRRKNFPDEPLEVTLALILLNIGKRFTPVECQEQEWRGFKKDVPSGEGKPKCPNGHTLFMGQGITLGWILAED